jgi:hypothetical protein
LTEVETTTIVDGHRFLVRNKQQTQGNRHGAVPQYHSNVP